MRVKFDSTATESDVEQFFVAPFLTEPGWLAIPDSALATKRTLKEVQIDKGAHRRWYLPDYVAYSDRNPILVVEAKAPKESAALGFQEAQLYAHALNAKFPTDINPAQLVMATNGVELLYGRWDVAEPSRVVLSELRRGDSRVESIIAGFGWDTIQSRGSTVRDLLSPSSVIFPHELLGLNRVRLAKVGYNSLFEELDPLLRSYFDSKNAGYEDLIVERAYVSTEDTTKYERSFENFLRERTVHGDDSAGIEISTGRRTEKDLNNRLSKSVTGSNKGYIQLIIGGVGSGKTTFIKRFFNYLLEPSLKEKLAICRLNFNHAQGDIQRWVCDRLIDDVRKYYGSVVDLSEEAGLLAVFSKEIKDNKGAYDLLRKSNRPAYEARLANDLLNWMADRPIFVRGLARLLAERRRGLMVIFDNVDRRNRDEQLSIFQVTQWFMALTQAFCIVTLRDETYEVYKDEKPLDTYAKSGNFYIRPPRFVDMIRRRLDLALADLASRSDQIATYDIEGLGTVTYPKTRLGEYLKAVYLDVFRANRRVTILLEGLAGKNVRKALEMFNAILTSAHFDTRDFTASGLTIGYKIQEVVLLKSLMRTSYLYFMENHGFVHNICDFSVPTIVGDYFVKIALLDFLIANRKKIGDIRYEGYFTVEHLCQMFAAAGCDKRDVVTELSTLLLQGMIISERLVIDQLEMEDSVRVHASGYVHARLCVARVEYIASVALVTPIGDPALAEKVSSLWRIVDPRKDISRLKKNILSDSFVTYLEDKLSERETRHGVHELVSGPARAMIGRMREAIGFTHGNASERGLRDDGLEDGYDALFAG